MDTLLTLLESNIYIGFLFDFAINLITVTVLCYCIYYKRYHDKEAFTSYMLFNVFVFTVITVLFNTNDNMSIGLGFGLFAILSIITLRSETLGKIEITYFFGALSIAIINAIGLADYPLLILCNSLVVLGAWIIDNPNILPGVSSMRVVLDHIPDGVLSNSENVCRTLGKKFNIEVISSAVSNVDYVKDTVRLKMTYRTWNNNNNNNAKKSL